ncbi:hypothetical protein [Pelagibius sp.]|uniref:hypothetical protein n=1 Tax=Pelagibius sp. TaxID=1931238 RepID=UPI0026169CDA|nr:hypothetical protein [Pelagibius sp.]
MSDPQLRPGQQQSNSHIMALLSLKVLLLAFFILLNALSNFEHERSTAVLESVREAFRGIVPADHSRSSEAAALDIFEGQEDIAEALGRLFDDTLPVVQRSDAANTRTLQVDMPAGDLFADNSPVVSGQGLDTLKAIAAVLTDERYADQDYQVDFLYGLEAGDAATPGHLLELRRAGALVRTLEQDAVPSAHLSTGFMPSFSGQVRIHFTLPLPNSDGRPAAAGGG